MILYHRLLLLRVGPGGWAAVAGSGAPGFVLLHLSHAGAEGCVVGREVPLEVGRMSAQGGRVSEWWLAALES